MKTLKIKFKTLDEIPISLYIEIVDILENEKFDNNIELYIKILSKITDMSEKELKEYDFNSIKMLMGEMERILNRKPSENSFAPFSIDNIKYKFDSKLHNMKTGMFIDLCKFTENPFENLHIISSILYRPIKDFEYKSESVIERANLFKDKLDINRAYSACFFLSILKGISFLNTLEYLEKLEKVKKK